MTDIGPKSRKPDAASPKGAGAEQRTESAPMGSGVAAGTRQGERKAASKPDAASGAAAIPIEDLNAENDE